MTATTVVIEGGACNKSFVLDLLAQPEVVDGTPAWADTGWIDRVRAEGRLVAHAHAGDRRGRGRDRGVRRRAHASRSRGCSRPPTAVARRRQHQAGRPVELKLRGTTYQVSTINTGPGPLPGDRRLGRRRADRRRAELDRVDDVPPPARRRRPPVPASSPPPTAPARSSRSTASPTGSAATRAACSARPRPRWSSPPPSPSATRSRPAPPVLVLESMKMETVLHAPFAARVKELLVITGSQVETGAALVKLEQVGDGTEEAVAVQDGPPSTSPARGRASAEVRAARARAALSAVVLGYDVPPQDQDAALAEYLAAREELRAEGVSVVADEMALLGTFADLAELSRNRPARRGAAHRAARAQLARALPHLPAEPRRRARRPAGAVPRPAAARAAPLRRRGPRAHARDGGGGLPDLPGPAAVGPRGRARRPRCSAAGSTSTPPTGELAVRARQLLERLGRATQLRYPVVGDLARSVRFRWFDQPAVDAERADVLAGVRDELAALAADGDLADRAARIEALAAIPEQIVALPVRAARGRRPGPGADAGGAGAPALPRVRPARPAGRSSTAGPFVVADYTLDERPTRLVSTVGTMAELADPSGELADVGRDPPRGAATGDEAVVDLYLHWPDAPESADEASEQLRPAGRGAAVRPRRTPGLASRCARAAAGRSATSPSGPTRGRRRGRGRPHPRRAPDGRPPAQPVAAAQLRRHPDRGARGRPALRVRRPREPGRPAAGGAGPGAPARRRPRRRGRASPGCRTPSVRSRTASRRSGGRGWPAAPRAPSST